jgi:hypothetical protein
MRTVILLLTTCMILLKLYLSVPVDLSIRAFNVDFAMSSCHSNSFSNSVSMTLWDPVVIPCEWIAHRRWLRS